MDSKFLTYRGDIKAMLALGGTVVFVTVHPEGQATALYRLDADKLQLKADPLPCGGVGLAAAAEGVWVLGTDGKVHSFAIPAKDVSAPPSSGPLVPLFGDRLAHLAGSEVLVLARKTLKVVQTLPLPEEGAALAVDPTGQWLVAGTVKGNVLVFECEDRPAFELSASEKLHEGAVTALLFEPQELRFYSAGADNKLLSTHARGRLEPEDKGRGGNHSDHITALVWGPADRFFSGSKDKTVKSWPRATNLRPITLKDDVIKVVGLAVVALHKKTQLVVACDDNTLRFFALDDEGKFGEPVVKVCDAYARAKSELNRDETPRRDASLRELAAYNDAPAVEMIGEQITADADHGLRLLGTQLLGGSGNPRAVKILEKSLTHNDEAVRVAALAGLRTHLGENELAPLDLALKAEKADVGRLAVQALEKLAARDDQAFARLTDALNVRTWEVRQAALFSLEKLFPADSPDANILALGSQHPDLRRLTLLHLFQRKLLDNARVQTFVRNRMEDADAEVRRTAFLLTLYTKPKLVQGLRELDAELQRQLIELEALGPDGAPTKVVEAETAKAAKKKKATPPVLEETDLAPLLQATASRSLDTCLRGGRGLAVLHDPRAFGLLLQLSRQDDVNARVEVCRAMAALEDPRAIKRLGSLLFDANASVRDAAFSALQHLYADQPLRCAELGLAAGFEDVRRRGLQGLIAQVRRKLPRSEDDLAWRLLVQAMNDSFAAVRSEAFKAALNLQIAGGGVNTLRFVLQSVHADVRLEVLTEAMAQINEPWAWPLLLTFFNDADQTLRTEAFEFALKKSKELEPLEAALCSKHLDIRRSAVQALIKKKTKPAQALLAQALNDDEKEVRQLALGALIDEDAEAALVQVLQSAHADVRVRAARALAMSGNRAALATLLKLATAPEPEKPENIPEWSSLVEQALDGLAELGDPDTLEILPALLASKQATLRGPAARTLVRCSRPDHPEALDQLRAALMHGDDRVKYQAALGLAFAGDSSVTALVFSEQGKSVLQAHERLVAAVALGVAGEDYLALFLDDADEALRNRALILLMLLELKSDAASPSRCLTCLSALMPRVRLTAARGLEAFSAPAAFLAFVVELFNDRGEEAAWKVPAESVEALALLLSRGTPFTRLRTALLLSWYGREQSTWDMFWAVHKRRFASELAALQAAPLPAVKPEYTPEQLQELAFGAYLGLVREQGRANIPAAQLARVRVMAVARIVNLASGNPRFRLAAMPVLVQCLADPTQTVRLSAFESLQQLGLDSATLGAEALETGHTDLGIKGLEVLTASAGAAGGQAVLERVMLTRKDNLAIEAARLLGQRSGLVGVAKQALEAAHEPMRDQAVSWLSAEVEKEPVAREALRAALTSRYQKVREAAAFALATKKDAAAFDALVKLLHAAQDAGGIQRVVNSLQTLGDPRTPDAYLDRLERDPLGVAPADRLIGGAGGFRLPAVAPRLFGLLERNAKWRKHCFDAVLAISGYDQNIADPKDDKADREWERKQHPRRDDLLAQLMEKVLAIGEVKLLARLLPGARWSRGPAPQTVLAQLVGHPEEELRRNAVEALGFRLRKRNGPVEPLLKALQHSDPVTQLNAAEGLARAGRADGLSVLLSAIEFMPEQRQRERAVQALGELGDARALDIMLKMASEETHPLQAVSAEALGHLGKTEKGGDIFRLLERYARGGPLCSAGLKGLRWLNTHDAWKVIRERAADEVFSARAVAIDLLGNNDDAATRDLLLRLISAGPLTVVNSATQAARRLWGENALEPDYALLQHPSVNIHAARPSLDRVCNKGASEQILAVLPTVQSNFQEELVRSVINRSELPTEAAKQALASTDARTCHLAAQIVGRAGRSAGNCEQAVTAALQHWRGEWEKRRQEMFQSGRVDNTLERSVTPCVRGLLWAAGRLGAATSELIAAVQARPDDALYRPLRLEAVAALGSDKLTAEVATPLTEAAQGSDPTMRTLAAALLGRGDPKRAADLAEKLLSDHVSFGRLATSPGVDVEGLLRAKAGDIHYQGVVLTHLLARGEVQTLTQVADNAKLPLAARMGAVEGLASLAREDAEERLLAVAKKDGEEEELRKAAWRGLRRSKRARTQNRTSVAR